MDTITVTILEPRAGKMLDDLEAKKLIKIDKVAKKKKKDRLFGSMKGLVIHMADDFNAPMEEFNKDENVVKKSKSELRNFYLSAPVMTDEELKRYKETRRWVNNWR